MTIRGLLLDVGGVFFVPDGEILHAALSEAGLDVATPDYQMAHFAAVHQVAQCWDEVNHGDQAYVDGYLEALGVSDFDVAVEVIGSVFRGQRAINLWRQPIPGSVEGLTALARMGLRIGVVSNSDGTVAELLAQSGVCQVGDGPAVAVLAIIDSAVVSVAKPDPDSFNHGIEAVGLPASQIAYVGDSLPHDVRGAQNAGLLPMHFDPYDLCGLDDHCHVGALVEVVDLIDLL